MIEDDDLFKKYDAIWDNVSVDIKKCKYIEKKVIRHIIDDLESFSGGSDYSDDE